MPKNNKENLNDMKKGELEKKLALLEESIRVIRFKSEGSKSKNVKESSAIKKQIAQILTRLGQLNKK